MSAWPNPVFKTGDKVTYVQSFTRMAIHHGTVAAAGYLTTDEVGEEPYRVYRVTHRNGGEGSPWDEMCMVRGWLEPLTAWLTGETLPVTEIQA